MAVTVKYLSNVMSTDDVIGNSVNAVREKYAGAFSMPDDVRPFLNGEQTSEDDEVEDGDELEFRKVHGEKGE